MSPLRILLTALPAAGFAFFGVQKFGAENAVFAYLAEQSGIGLFEPLVRYATGVAELLAAALILAGLFVPKLRGLGGLLGLAIVGGAIVLHLTPWLGVNAPVGFDETGEYVRSPFLFFTALGLAALTAGHVVFERLTSRG
jgi:hypothetical protein